MKVNGNIRNEHNSLETKTVDAHEVKLSNNYENAMELYERIAGPCKSTKLVSAIWAQGPLLYRSIATWYSEMSDCRSFVSLVSSGSHSAGLVSLAGSDDESATCEEDGPVALATCNPLLPASVRNNVYHNLHIL